MSDKRSIDPAAVEMLKRAEEMHLSTAFSRAEEMKPCPIGAKGQCCKLCGMGPCRVVKEGQTGICGATVDTIAARNLVRMIAGGAAAHSDHGRDMAFALIAVAQGEAPGYEIKDEGKLLLMAKDLGVETEGRTIEEIALEVGQVCLGEFGKQRGEVIYACRAPEARQQLWRQAGLMPRGIDREIVEIMHRTHIGDDQDAEHILRQGLRAAIADGWGGSMYATDISDVLFGTPSPLVTKANLGVLKEDEVNVVVHGHEPTLSMAVVDATRDPDLIEYAKSKGAKGINIAGMCCTSNETLMRQGVPSAGNFLTQELAIITGAVEAMVVDVQCIMQALGPLSEKFHTKLITTSPKVKIKGAVHIEFDEHRAPEIAKEIIKTAIDNYPNRKEVRIPGFTTDLVPGFSHEYIRYMQGGYYRASFRPLNDAIIAGRVRGAAGVVGCNNPRVCHDDAHHYIVTEFLKNDVLVVQTGCGAIANAKYGLLQGEAALEYAGPGLREVCEAIGIPPVLHMGSCVDNSRILTLLTEVATEGGVGTDISDIPVVGIAPEWMSEKAISIGTYCVASGVYTLFGVGSPVEGSEEVTRLIGEGWEKLVGARLELGLEPEDIVKRSLAHIDAKRKALGIQEYDPSRFGRSGDRRMQEWLKRREKGEPVSLYKEAAS